MNQAISFYSQYLNIYKEIDSINQTFQQFKLNKIGFPFSKQQFQDKIVYFQNLKNTIYEIPYLMNCQMVVVNATQIFARLSSSLEEVISLLVISLYEYT